MRELKCRIGDLAIVTKCGVPERIGLLVRVIARADAPHDWLTEIQGAGVVARGFVTGKVGLRNQALMHDWNLTPIRGEELIDEEEKQEALHE
jgi:hypothetical protein